jgi:hypothetical protein
MDAHEIVVHREQRNGMRVVLDFFENALVSRVNRRVYIRTLRLERSENDVLMCFRRPSALAAALGFVAALPLPTPSPYDAVRFGYCLRLG